MSGYNELIADLERDLEEAKLREAELASALEIARSSIKTSAKIFCSLKPFVDEQEALRIDPSAALAERERTVREKCAQIVLSYEQYYKDEYCELTVRTLLGCIAQAIREFGLEPKTEGE